MPIINIECCNCGNREEVTSWDCDNWATVCPQCNNDVCDRCRDNEHLDYHNGCYELGIKNEI